MAEGSEIIDVWDVATFDAALRAELNQNAELIRAYVDRDNAIFLAHDHGNSPRRSLIRPENEHTRPYMRLSERIMAVMNERTIRAWHYTRMTDDNVARLRAEGIRLSTPEMLRERLDRLVAAGFLTAEQAERLFAKSPFNSDQGKSRADKFYMVSHPQALTCSGVRGLLGFWGGEVASFFVQDEEMATPLAAIGASRVLEVVTPVSATRNAYNAGEAVIGAYARSLGCVESGHAFDVCAIQALPRDSILRIHTRGEPDFAAMIATYPPGYIDVSQTFWKELTGEDD